MSHTQRVLSFGMAIALAAGSLAPAPGAALAGSSPSPEPLVLAPEVESPAVPEAPPQPAALAGPLSLVRTQSAVRPSDMSGGRMTITFTVFNNLPPVLRPAVPTTATVTDTIAILSGYDGLSDPNTVRGVLISDTLAAPAAFASASPAASRSGNAVVWSLGDVPPMGAVTATLTITLTPGGGDFTVADGGAVAHGALQGRRVSARANPAMIGNEALGAFLIRTPDADSQDAYVLRKAAELGSAGAPSFEYVKGAAFESYSGSLRGARGTLWANAANALDKSSLLIALLRASGVPARYRHGTLITSTAQSLIASMFITPTRVQGFVPSGATTSDPLNDPALLAETRDHWWVEAYLGGTWTDLDPSFAGAAVGATFNATVAGDGTDRIAEVPDVQRHKVTVRLKVEQYNFPFISLKSLYPLSHTFNSVDVAGKPVALAHSVNPQAAGGLVFATYTTDYLPYFIIGDDPATAEIITGDPFQDVASSFASVQQLHIAEWLQFDVRSSAGVTTSFEREVVDLLGYDKRQSGGDVSFNGGSGSQPLVQSTDLFSTWFWSGRVPFEAIQRAQAAAINNIPQFTADLQTINTLQYATSRTPEQEAQYNAAVARLPLSVAGRLALVGLTFAVRADDALDFYGTTLQVKAYHAAPRIVTVGTRSGVSQTIDSESFTVDLRTTTARSIAFPGQPADAAFAFQQNKGFLESQFEQEVLEQATGLPAIGAAQVVSEALALGVPVVSLDDTMLDELAALALSDQAKARITSAVLAGKEVLVPSQGISLSGKLRYAWFESDKVTGEMVGVMENGLHIAAIEYAGLLGNGLKALTAFMVGFAVGLWAAITPVLVDKLGGDKAQAQAQMKLATKQADAYAKAFCEGPNKGAKKACNMAYKGGKKVGGSMVTVKDPPLPEIEYGVPPGPLPTHAPARATATVNATPNLPAGALAAALSTSMIEVRDAARGAALYAGVSGGLSAGGAYTGAANFAGSASLTVVNGSVAADGASGAITLGGSPAGVLPRFAAANFSGQVNVTDTGATDAAAIAGTGTLFALGLSSAASAIGPLGTASFNAVISTSAAGAFSLTVEAPEGWNVGVTAAGVITAQPPLGAAAGQHGLLVVAQSQPYPRLSLDAVHTVTVSSFEGMQMSLSPDPFTTVPLGRVQSDNALNDTNDGRMQLSGAAFNVEITNTSNITRSFSAAVSGLTAGWLIFGGNTGATTATVALPPGGIGRFGLYVSPTLPLPAAGTNFPFTVNVTGIENPSLTGSDNDVFSVPSTPYAFLSLSPAYVYATAGATTSLDLRLQNVGNTAGAFAVSFASPTPTWSASYAPSMSASAGATVTQRVTLTTPTGAPGEDYITAFNTSSGGYSQTAYALVLMTTLQAACVYRAGDGLLDLAGAPVDRIDTVGDATAALESDKTNIAKRDALIAAIDGLLAELDALPPTPAGAALAALADSMAAHTTEPQITADLAALCSSMTDLSLQLRAALERNFSAAFTPGSDAALPGRTVTLTFEVTNHGTLTTTYNVTITSPALGAPTLFAPTLAPGAVGIQAITITSASAGFVPVYGDVSAGTGLEAFPVVADQAIGGVSFITPTHQVIDVTPSPGFVDFGTSATSIAARVANAANWRMNGLATLSVIAPGGAVSATAMANVVLPPGNPSTVNFGSLNTSGYQTGTYTVSVTVAISAPTGLAGASSANYGFFSVGQALYASGALSPGVVAPGNVTVTTILTTTSNEPSPILLAASTTEARGLPQAQTPAAATSAKTPAVAAPPTPTKAQSATTTAAPPTSTKAPAAPTPAAPISTKAPTRPVYSGGGVSRLDAAAAATVVTGTWASVNSNMASGGTYSRTSVVSATLAFTFTGSWVSLGYLADDNGRNFEVFIDGVSQGAIDSYARFETPRSRAYGGLISATHVISIFVLGSKNAFAPATAYAKIDYIDAWDGATMSDGTFEQDDPRVIRTSGWNTQTLAAASGGNYGLGPLATGAAWFAFTGDSVTYQMVKDFNNAGIVSVFVDGVWKTDVNLKTTFGNTAANTATVSFNGLGAGPHVATLVIRRGFNISLDAFITPGVAPFYAPPPRTGINRTEERDAAVLFNGAPYTATKTSWAENTRDYASDLYVASTATSSDTVTYVFSGTWVALGYVAGTNGGRVEVFIDGASQGVLDTFGHEIQPRNAVFSGLSAVTHTISATLLVTKNAFAGNPGTFYFDYIDTWDGSTLAAGTFEEDSPRVWYSGSWSRSASGAASGGYVAVSPLATGAAWFPFTGDSVSAALYFGLLNAGVVNVSVDGVFKARLDLASPITGATDFTRTFAFNGLGAGPHVLNVQLVRGLNGTFDAFTTPAVAPFYAPPTRTGMIRYEEWDAALLFNATPLRVSKTTWSEAGTDVASDGFTQRTSTVSDVVSLAFTGTWASLGYVAATTGARVEVYVDGLSRGVLDTYSPSAEPRSLVISGLTAGPHVISATHLGTRNAFASLPGYFYFDYIDVWDGSALPAGAFEETDARVWYSRPNAWTWTASGAASGGYYARSPLATGSAWFAFAGDSVSLDTLAGIPNAGELVVWIDGAWKGYHEMYGSVTASRTLSFDGLGPGPHMLTLSVHRGFNVAIDRFAAPGSAPYISFARSGVYRLEEDDPAIRYNGAPLTQTVTTWIDDARDLASNRYVMRGDTAGNTVSLTFTGKYVGVGLYARSDGRQAEIFLDGASQGIVDTYSATDGLITRIYSGLISSTHVISVMVLSTFNVSATGGTKSVRLDYFDVWDGAPSPAGVFQPAAVGMSTPRVFMSNDWTTTYNASAISGTMAEDGSSLWFLFAGMTVTVIAVTDQFTTAKAEVLIDDVSAGVLDLFYAYGRQPKAFTFSGLSDGAHVVRVRDASGATRRTAVDGFDTRPNPSRGAPMVEWAFSAVISPGLENFATSPAVGDIDGDGMSDIVATTSDESCLFIVCSFVNRAVYALKGDGSGVIFSRTFTGSSAIGAGERDQGIGSPAIVNLDGGADIEVIVPSGNGLHALKSDGSLLWWNQNVRGNFFSAVAVGNVDADDAPEIVATDFSLSPGFNRVHIVQPDGASSWIYTFPATLPAPRAPVLADMNGDARLDIVIASGRTLYLFLNNGVSMTLAYTRGSGANQYGSPAIADIDGDGLPEVVIGWDGIVTAYENDLTPKWTYSTTGVYPSSVSIANLDADPSPEIVIYSKTSGPGGEEGRVFALNADGTLLWSRPTKDTTNSSAGVAVLDLDGDQVYDVVWNGYTSGTLILHGSDGEITFQDDQIHSGTVNETPVIADVDADGRAELVLVNLSSLVVLGFDAVWGPARPIWHQHSYHITDIFDDLSVPSVEPNSWQYHNTYRTQSPLSSPLPVYRVTLSHTVGLSGVNVLTSTFNLTPSVAVSPTYVWSYTQYAFGQPVVRRFDALLTGMQPGEVRQVSQRTDVSYTLSSGSNQLALPPLYAVAAHIADITPLSRTVNRGASGQYVLTLTNPSASAAVYTLTLAGLPSAFTSGLPPTRAIAANATVTVAFAIGTPADAAIGSRAFAVQAANASGGSEAVNAALDVVDAARVRVVPDSQSTGAGGTATYTLVITNLEAVARTYTLTLSGLAGATAAHPATATVPAGGALSVPLTITAGVGAGTRVFSALVVNAATGAGASDDATLVVGGTRAVAAAFRPAVETTGLSTDAWLTVTLTNTGALSDTYDLQLAGRPDWTIVFERSGANTETQTLTPFVFNAADLRLRVNANGADGPGTYPITVTARSRIDPALIVTATGAITVLNTSALAYIDPPLQSAVRLSTTQWTLYVENTGGVAATFNITVAGELGGQTRLGAPSVALSPGGTAAIPMTVTVPSWALAGPHAIKALVTAAAAPAVRAIAEAELDVSEAAALAASLTPPLQTVTGTAQTSYGLYFTNTGTTELVVALEASSTALVTVSPPSAVLPVGVSGYALVTASAPNPGTHPITVTASSVSAAASATALLKRGAVVYVPSTRRDAAGVW